MAPLVSGRTSTSYLAEGESILTVLRTLDISTIKCPIADFAKAHAALGAAYQYAVGVADRVGDAQRQLAEINAELDDRVTQVADGLVADGAGADDPLQRLGSDWPSAIKSYPIRQKAAAIKQIVTVIARNKSSGKLARAACERAVGAISQVTQVAATLEREQAALDQARHGLDAAAQTWLNALVVLKRAVHSAAEHGAPGLYAAAFNAARGTALASKRP